MASAATIAKEVLKALLSMGLGGASRSIAGGVASRIFGNMGAQQAGFVSRNYPDEFAPDRYHNYTVHNFPDSPNFNEEGKAFAGTIEEAGRMQTIDEHNKAIRQFVRPGMTPREERNALNMGLEAEKQLPQFWNESKSRVPFSVSSSAVTGIRLTPDARIEIQWKGKPTWYTFRQYGDTHEASLAAQELLRADSIGQAVMPYQRNGKMVKYKNPSLAWWNRKNYDGAFAR